MKKLLFFIIIIFIMLTNCAFAKHNHLEREYQLSWWTKFGGELECVLEDGSRVDIVTDEYAIEFDFIEKWAEAIGQSLYYAYALNKKPMIVIIVENPNKAEKNLRKLRRISEKLEIKVEVMTKLFEETY